MNRIYFLLASSLTIAIGCAAPPKDIEPTGSNYREWTEYIRPSDDESKWQAIAWRNKMMPAVEEAKQLDRPILLWAMNGNPCGET